jgi:hypothetical protein
MLDQGLAQPGDVSVSKDPEHGWDQSLFPAIALAVLGAEKAHDRLTDREALRGRVNGAVQQGLVGLSVLKAA